MKKVLLAAAVIAMFGLASCNKEKKCECVTTMNGTVIQTMDYETKDDCASLEIHQGFEDFQQTMKCTEK